MAKHAFIIGAGGQIGYACARELIRRGWRVTAACRRAGAVTADLVRQGVTITQLDRNDPEALSRALAEGADAIIDTVAFDETHAKQLLALQDRISSLVVVSSSSIYCDHRGRTLDEARQNGFPDFSEAIRETQSTVPAGPQTYSTRKVALERQLLDQANIPVVILRPGAIHGTPSTHPREWWFVKRIRDARPLIPLAYAGRSRFHTCAAENIATLIGAALERPQTRILNVADPHAPSALQIGELIAAHLGYAGRIVPLEIGDAYGNAPAGWSPWSTPGPFLLDTNAADQLRDRPALRYEDTIGSVCDWLVAQSGKDWRSHFPVLAAYPMELFDYAAEDSFLARWEGRQ